MRILFVTPFVPSPATGNGGATYLAQLAEALAKHRELHLLAFGEPGQPVGGPWQSATVVQSPDAMGRRTLSSRWCALWRWRHSPLVAAKAWQPAMAAAIADVHRTLSPAIALFEMAQLAQYLPFLHGTPSILTDHEAGCAANTRTGLGPFGDARDRRLWSRYVDRFYPQATALQAVTEADARHLAARIGRPVAARPPTVPIPALPVAPEQAPPRLLFLGDYRHGPNAQAAHRLVREVLPAVRAGCSAAELWLAGPNDDAIRDLGRHAGVRVLGFVPDLAALLGQVRALLAPLWSGDGFRVKVMTALAHGVPVVTNALGARGGESAHGALTIAESTAALADATIKLLREPAHAAAAGRAARAWAIQNLGADAVATWQLARIDAVLANRR